MNSQVSDPLCFFGGFGDFGASGLQYLVCTVLYQKYTVQKKMR